ncbi:PEP-CTERM sorting domain-containing protein [Aliiglaciecola sp. CAU 1673]|uniref:PEP-CTERM sorting domain-containing protein n=1 Tax=Aliiglaciecola sp. CAU 1673 TaxID=3032595 RepID=UPI0023DAA300|nr:PEP-CTERM sorting domain-containing protein [Aliiglaciecola sp. CAU 1673]MDF2177222.1 PEP-CTERM sorting domain-containing protein [Aliiglaciecola sp. CAU 1673]
MKKILASLSLLAAIGSANASIIVDTSLWSLFPDPSYSSGPTGLTSAGGNQAVQNSNSYGTIVSDFSFTGDFNFSGSMTPTTASFDDNDLLGLVFGWTDQSNHYRLGWEQGGYNDISGASGLYLVRELGGISSILFQSELFWQDNEDYNFVVGRSGNNISFSITGLIGGVTTTVAQSFTDTTFMSGNVGFWTASQTARFGGLASAPQAPSTEVPEPSMLALFGLSLLLLVRRARGV